MHDRAVGRHGVEVQLMVDAVAVVVVDDQVVAIDEGGAGFLDDLVYRQKRSPQLQMRSIQQICVRADSHRPDLVAEVVLVIIVNTQTLHAIAGYGCKRLILACPGHLNSAWVLHQSISGDPGR